jgi:hypothetical protein
MPELYGSLKRLHCNETKKLVQVLSSNNRKVLTVVKRIVDIVPRILQMIVGHLQ